MEKNRSGVSVIIPAFNEERSIAEVISKIKALGGDYEIIVVDDGSTDRTYERAREKGVKVIHHLHNRGYGASLKTGIKNARGDVVVFVDADGQHDPMDIQRILQYMGEYDMVVGARTDQSHNSLFRRPGKKVLSTVANYLSGTKIPDLNSGLRAVKADVVDGFMHLLPDTFSFSTTLTLLWLKSGRAVKYVPITTYKRVGTSSVNIITDGLNTLVLILRMTMLYDPLKVFLPISILLVGGGTAFGLYTLVTELAIWKSSLLLILSGIIIFFFGLLADQIAMLHQEVRKGSE